MAIVKHKRSPNLYTRFTAPNGKRIFQSTRTTDRRSAEEYETRLKARLWREVQLGESQATWQEAVVSWLKSTTHKDRKTVLQKLRWLNPHLSHLQLRQIDSGTLYGVRDAKLADKVSPATVNRHLAVVSAVLHHARRREWLSAVPHIPLMKEPKGRIRFLSHDEARALVAYLQSRPRSQHLADMVEFSLATGLRESNVTGLEWGRVDIERRLAWITLDETKGADNLRVPLNDIAVSVLERRQGIHKRWCFTYRGKRIVRANRGGYREAVAAMGWDDVNWHTLRHTWASWHVMAGTPVQVLKELGGWKSLDMVLRYAHLAPDHLDNFAGNVIKDWRTTGTDENE